MSHRPKIPSGLVKQMEEKPAGVEVDHLYQINGYGSKTEFVRQAVREKLARYQREYDVESTPADE